MLFTQVPYHAEILELGGEGSGGVAGGRESGAELRAVDGERTDDDVAVGCEGLMQHFPVPVALAGFGEEVEHCPVVPEAVPALGMPVQEVSRDPVDVVGRGAEPRPCRAERFSGDVQNGDVLVAAVQELVDER
jgi:hypothetical protein